MEVRGQCEQVCGGLYIYLNGECMLFEVPPTTGAYGPQGASTLPEPRDTMSEADSEHDGEGCMLGRPGPSRERGGLPGLLVALLLLRRGRKTSCRPRP